MLIRIGVCGMNSVYSNEMRHAVRAVKNPTSLHFDVAQKDNRLFLLVDKNLFARLEAKDKRDFLAYIKDILGIIRLGGAEVEVGWIG